MDNKNNNVYGECKELSMESFLGGSLISNSVKDCYKECKELSIKSIL